VLSVPNQPPLDKARLLGGCVRLPVAFDHQRLQAEVARLPCHLWGGSGGRVGVHNAAEAIFLRGHAPAEGDLPIEEREALALLPYVRELIHVAIPAQPMRCLLAKLPGGATIAPHVDRGAPYFSQTVRIHIPVVTHQSVWMFCNGKSYKMACGEAWALNNSSLHAVWNADPVRERLHLICDFRPGARLLGLIAAGEHDLGADEPAVREHLFRGPAPSSHA
jgi:aspartyl/asparaginyl beta-hydroxylase